MQYIPRKSKVKTEIFRDFGFVDLFVAMLGIVIFGLILSSTIPNSFYLSLSFLSFWLTLYIPLADDVRLYFGLILLFKFAAYKKKYFKKYKRKSEDIKRIVPFESFNTDKFISYGDYYSMSIEINPMSFFLLNEEKQDMVVSTMTRALQRLSMTQKCQMMKVRKPMILDANEKYEDFKYNNLNDMAERGIYNEEELEMRAPLFEERLQLLKYLNQDQKILKDTFYLTVFDSDREALESTVNGIVSSLENSVTPIYANIVTGVDRASMLRSTFTDDFDERELETLSEEQQIDWALPNQVQFKATTTKIDNKLLRTFTVTDYPLEVPNAWMYSLFSMEESKVVVNLTPLDKYKAERMLDKSLMEMSLKLEKDGKASKQIENQTQYDTLKILLQSIKNSNENLFDCNIHIVTNEKNKKEVRAVLRQNGFRYTENFGRQIDGFVSANTSRLDTLSMYNRGIQTTAIASMFPFISNILQDIRGFYIGYNSYPVFTNFFMRNNERVNSNMVVIGKSGAGKSYFAKMLLTNLVADNTRIYILDPENEYDKLARNIRGNWIDVGSNVKGIFNPFHIYTTLEDDDGQTSNAFNAHLQFLEQFFRIILNGMSYDAFEVLNSVIAATYARKGITAETQITELQPEDFPIFDDLFAEIQYFMDNTKDQYLFTNYQVCKTFVEKFASGGRNSALWNGKASIVTNENFIVFNFQRLFSNRNEVVTNAQMLLVFKYLDNEISKNRDFNLKYFPDAKIEEEKRRVVVVVDEAHLFINKKFPVALDFMVQMAKRIRKYSGMQIILTQNIKDFVGTPEIAQQSTAIINASQYSVIFALAPNDMTDLIELYRNAGGINKEEQDSIVTAARGQCFLITGAMSRTTVQIEALAGSLEVSGG